ncbi:MAG: hypothetical protein HY828_03500 [Actinobacteria bacterium]|nr:hypothetical protein [Actinomycetota bacterium]
MIWLLEPGSLVTHDGQQPPVASHDLDADLFRARSRRAAMLYWKFLDDACSSVRLEFGEGSAEHTEAVSNRTEAKHIVAELSGDTNAFPSSTDFANMTIQFVYKLNGQAVTDATKHVYKRLSETAHGGLYGLYGDKTVDPQSGHYGFVQDDADLDAVARQVGIWWYATTQLVASGHGWSWASEFSEWDREMRRLFN